MKSKQPKVQFNRRMSAELALRFRNLCLEVNRTQDDVIEMPVKGWLKRHNQWEEK